MKIRSIVLGPVIVAVFTGGIALSIAFNVWNTKTVKQPARISSGAYIGEYDPSGIRGSFTFGDIARTFDIPLAVLTESFGIGDMANPETIRTGDLETLYEKLPGGAEVGNDSVRLFVSLYKGIPYYPEETTRLFETAIPFLEKKLSSADLQALENICVPVPVAHTDRDVIVNPPEEHENASGAGSDSRTISGKTTFNDLLAWGISEDRIEKVLGMEMGPRNELLRDYLSRKGLGFGTYKEEFQQILDSSGE